MNTDDPGLTDDHPRSRRLTSLSVVVGLAAGGHLWLAG